MLKLQQYAKTGATMIQFLAKLISFVFHPLLVLTYMLLLLLFINPYLFGVNHWQEKSAQLLVLQVFLSSFFIPGVAVVLLRFSGLVQSLDFPEREDRIGPYIVTGIFYLWLFRNICSNELVPSLYSCFVLGATIALFVAFVVNIFTKISAHATGMGGFLAMMLIAFWQLPNYPYARLSWESDGGTWWISTSFILLFGLLCSGLVGSSRLLLKAHTPQDLYNGYLVGFGAQFVALRFVVLPS